jgi:alpha-methylacyl-CoA racemase
MMLADMGATVTRIDTLDAANFAPNAIALRGRQSVTLDLKACQGLHICMELVKRSDAVFEGFRPGVAERLGIGPAECMAVNPRLVYGRMTGWGQTGPLAHLGGHDINYISVSGALASLSLDDERPRPPLNLLGDYAGGGMILAYGLVCALLESNTSGSGQVVDAAMVDGSAMLLAAASGRQATGTLRNSATYLAQWYYNVYRTSDNHFVSVGALETKFRDELRNTLRGQAKDWGPDDPESKADPVDAVANLFASRTRAEWNRTFDGRDACFTPVVSLGEVTNNPHLQARSTYVNRHGFVQPSPAPRFSRSPGHIGEIPSAGEHTATTLAMLGYSDAEISDLQSQGAVGGGRN